MRCPSSLPLALLASALFVAPGCEKTTPPPGEGTPGPAPADGGQVTPPTPTPTPVTDRSLAVPDDHPMFARYEGEGFPNDCTADANCHVGGCSSEVCSADEGVITTCEVIPAPLPAGSECGCVEDQCRWWNAGGETLPATDPPPAPPSESGGDDCGGQVCKAPTECIEYYGIAGPKGPKLFSCEIPCKSAASGKGDKGVQGGEGACPDGMKCITIADGPGRVCR